MPNNKHKNIVIQKDEIKEVCPCCINKRNKRARKRILKKNVFKNKKATK